MKNTKTTLNKKISVLAGAVLAASSSQAAFDQGNAVLFAYNGSNDNTYFVDLGISGQDLVDTPSVHVTNSGLAGFLSSNAGAQWTVIASVNDTTRVGGPPAYGQSLMNSGVVSTSLTGSAVGSSSNDALVQRDIMNAWLADVQAASGGNASFLVAGTDPVSSDNARNGGFFNNSLISVGYDSSLYYSQANPSVSANLADALVVSQVGTTECAAQSVGISAQHTFQCGISDYRATLFSDGTFVASAVPVPAAAWLFGSALAGLGVVRRKK